MKEAILCFGFQRRFVSILSPRISPNPFAELQTFHSYTYTLPSDIGSDSNDEPLPRAVCGAAEIVYCL